MTQKLRPEADEKTQTQPQDKAAVVCKECNQLVTFPEQAITVAGKHEHTFRNPAGYSFHLLCYNQAPGALRAGEDTQEACWFAGYAWSFALCCNCHQHLGWYYTGPNSFAGLIATRVLRPPGP